MILVVFIYSIYFLMSLYSSLYIYKLKNIFFFFGFCGDNINLNYIKKIK